MYRFATINEAISIIDEHKIKYLACGSQVRLYLNNTDAYTYSNRYTTEDGTDIYLTYAGTARKSIQLEISGADISIESLKSIFRKASGFDSDCLIKARGVNSGFVSFMSESKHVRSDSELNELLNTIMEKPNSGLNLYLYSNNCGMEFNISSDFILGCKILCKHVSYKKITSGDVVKTNAGKFFEVNSIESDKDGNIYVSCKDSFTSIPLKCISLIVKTKHFNKIL